MSGPVVLRPLYTPLFLQLRDHLLTDTDPQYGLLAALGAGAASVYPRADFGDDGPTGDPDQTPMPFIILYDGGKDALDETMRELGVIVEIHEDRGHGIQRWPGLLQRLTLWIVGGYDAQAALRLPGFQPTSDQAHRYTGGLALKNQSPVLPDERFNTTLIQIMFTCRAADRTSGRRML